MGRSRTLLRLAAAAFTALAAGCPSPTLPLPPPGAPVVTQESTGYAEVYGGPGTAIGGALVMIYNDDTGTGVIATASSSGEFRARVDVGFSGISANGNTLEVWQRVGIADSPPLSILVRPKK